MTAVILDTFQYRLMWDLPPNLRAVTLKVIRSDFDTIKSKRAWEDDLSDDEFERTTNHCRFKRLTGLQNFTLVPDLCHYAKVVSQRAKWRENVQRLESFVMPYVVQVKDVTGRNLYHDLALYEGSKVPSPALRS